MKHFAFLPLIAAVAACQPASPQDEAPAAAPPAAEAPAEPAPVVSTTVSAAGVGPITAETAFDAEAIRALFPGAEVQAEFLHGDDRPAPIITVIGPGEAALEIQGGGDGRVGQIFISGGDITGPDGEALMAGWPELGLTAADCEMGEGRFVGQPVCRKAGAENLTYVLAVPNWTRSELPDPTTLNGRARLAGFVWTRP